MKSLFVSCFLLFLGTVLFAQQQDSITVNVDTINVRGFVYDVNSKPVKKIEIGLAGGGVPGYNAIVKTDDAGYFHLEGVNPNNILHFKDEKYSGFYFQVRGSRFIIIYLPPPTILILNRSDPIIVKAQRKYPKLKFSYRVLNQQGVFYDGFEKGPEYPGGALKLIDKIRQELVYPQKAIDRNIEGMVEIGFTIGKDGTLSDFKILQGIGNGCDEEVISILKKTAKWKPGLDWGRPISIQASVSVKFSLTDN